MFEVSPPRICWIWCNSSWTCLLFVPPESLDRKLFQKTQKLWVRRGNWTSFVYIYILYVCIYKYQIYIYIYIIVPKLFRQSNDMPTCATQNRSIEGVPPHPCVFLATTGEVELSWLKDFLQTFPVFCHLKTNNKTSTYISFQEISNRTHWTDP